MYSISDNIFYLKYGHPSVHITTMDVNMTCMQLMGPTVYLTQQYQSTLKVYWIWTTLKKSRAKPGNVKLKLKKLPPI